MRAHAAFLNDITKVIQIATALGETADAANYTAILQDLTTAFNSAFFNSNSNNYGNANGAGLQTANAAAIAIGLVPAGSVAPVAAALASDVTTTHNGHWSTGIFGE